LNFFQAAQSGDSKKQAILSRYDKFIEMKIEKEHWKQLVLNEVVCRITRRLSQKF